MDPETGLFVPVPLPHTGGWPDPELKPPNQQRIASAGFTRRPRTNRPERAATAHVRCPATTPQPLLPAQIPSPAHPGLSEPSTLNDVPVIQNDLSPDDAPVTTKPTMMQKPLVSRRIRYVRPRTAGHRRVNAPQATMEDSVPSLNASASQSFMEEDFSEQALREVFPSAGSSSSSSEEDSKETAGQHCSDPNLSKEAVSLTPDEMSSHTPKHASETPSPHGSMKLSGRTAAGVVRANQKCILDTTTQRAWQTKDIVQKQEKRIQQLQEIVHQKNLKILNLTRLLEEAVPEHIRQPSEEEDEPHHNEQEEDQPSIDEITALRTKLKAAYGYIVDLQNELEAAQSTITALQSLHSSQDSSMRTASDLAAHCCARKSSLNDLGMSDGSSSHVQQNCELGTGIGGHVGLVYPNDETSVTEVMKCDLPDSLAIRSSRAFEFEHFASYSNPFSPPVSRSVPAVGPALWMFLCLCPIKDGQAPSAVTVMDKCQVECQEEVSPRTFNFDRVFPAHTPQQEVFDEVLALVDSTLEPGGPGALCFMAYGPSGAGKTHLFYGPGMRLDEEAGVVYRAAFALFSAIEAAGAREACTVDCCMYLHRVDQFVDLLADDLPESLFQKPSARSQNSSLAQVASFFSGFRAWRAKNPVQLCDLITAGLQAIPSEYQHSCSVFCEVIVNRHQPLQHAGSLKMLFVDLAPSNIAQCKHLPTAAKATIANNLELLVVCLKAFAQGKPLPRQGNKFVDMITDVLATKSAKAQLFICSPQSPADSCVSTLSVAQRVRLVPSIVPKGRRKVTIENC